MWKLLELVLTQLTEWSEARPRATPHVGVLAPQIKQLRNS
jgi:hypothetical protein